MPMNQQPYAYCTDYKTKWDRIRAIEGVPPFCFRGIDQEFHRKNHKVCVQCYNIIIRMTVKLVPYECTFFLKLQRLNVHKHLNVQFNVVLQIVV